MNNNENILVLEDLINEIKVKYKKTMEEYEFLARTTGDYHIASQLGVHNFSNQISALSRAIDILKLYTP